MTNTVSPPLPPRTKPDAYLVGYALWAAMLLLLLPILPFLVVVRLLHRFLGQAPSPIAERVPGWTSDRRQLRDRSARAIRRRASESKGARRPKRDAHGNSPRAS